MASVAQAPASPLSSPRLPSPPPFPEVQLPPTSSSPGASADSGPQDANKELGEDTSATRRIRPGTKAADMATGPPLVQLSELDSPFQLQEHLLALFLSSTRSSDSTTIPINRESATALATPPEGVDRALWLYELCRLLVQRANSLIVGFFADSPPCSAAACPEMRASEWQYLCAVHDPPKSCCAIDYCCHTLDWAANVLTSQKHFPSRLSLGGDAPGSSQASVRQLTNVFRRVYRMFAHAWFQHRDVFWRVEGEEGLYVFYKTVCDVYGLIPEENYTVPKEAEGGGPEEVGRGGRTETEKDKSEGEDVENDVSGGIEAIEKPAQATLSTGATTRRHKHTPSTGSFVTTIAEGDEEGDHKGGEAPMSAASFVSTVRRDPSTSPTKKSVPLVKLPDVEDKVEEEAEQEPAKDSVTEPVQKEKKTEDVTEKINELSIEDETAKSGEEVTTEEEVAEEPKSEDLTEMKIAIKVSEVEEAAPESTDEATTEEAAETINKDEKEDQDEEKDNPEEPKESATTES